MDRLTRDGDIARTVRVLDLRNSTEAARATRSRVGSARKSLLPGSPVAWRPSTPGKAASPTKTASADDSFRGDFNLAAAAGAAARQQAMENAFSEMAETFASYVSAVERAAPQVAASLGYYCVTFGPGAFGMILSLSEDGSVEVAELRDDPATGAPLLAKASGKIQVGDLVLAINHHFLNRSGAPTLEQVAQEFKNAPRPVTVLFKRRV